MSVTIETTLANAAGAINKQREEFGNTSTLYRIAANLAAIQLDRPISPQEIARILACTVQAKIALRPDLETAYAELSAIMAVASSLSADAVPRLSTSERLEESLDETGRRLAKTFAPSLPKVEPQES